MRDYSRQSIKLVKRKQMPLQERLIDDIRLYNVDDFDKIFGAYKFCEKSEGKVYIISVNVFPEPIILHLRDNEVVISASNSHLGVIIGESDFERISDAYWCNRKIYSGDLPLKTELLLKDLLNYQLNNSSVVELYKKEVD